MQPPLLPVALALLAPLGSSAPAAGGDAPAAAAGGPAAYLPDWGSVPPSVVIPLAYDPKLDAATNGARLVAAIEGLAPGERLEVGGGVYVLEERLELAHAGTASAPVVVAAAAGQTPVLYRPGLDENLVDVGSDAPASYVALIGLALVGGSDGVRLHDAREIWIDRCLVLGVQGVGIAANSKPVDRLWITRNEITDTGRAGWPGEGIYLGSGGGAVASRCTLWRNYVHDTGGSHGDGIEIKQGSWGNRVVGNIVHDTRYPCILVYGTGGKAPNTIARNACWGSDDNVMQVQGEALVDGNLLVAGAVAAFRSGDHAGQTRDLSVVHNTIVSTGTAARLDDWAGRPGMTFANNACASQSGSAIHFSGGSAGVAVSGNVASGAVVGVSSGWTPGAGLADFVDLAFDGSKLWAVPTPTGALAGAADPAHATALDILDQPRTAPFEAGAVDLP